jgi:hypothetical protein
MSKNDHKSGDRVEIVGEDILPHIIKFAESEYFSLKVQKYLEKHEQVFADDMESTGINGKSDDGSGQFDYEELKLEYMDVFHGYQVTSWLLERWSMER